MEAVGEKKEMVILPVSGQNEMRDGHPTCIWSKWRLGWRGASTAVVNVALYPKTSSRCLLLVKSLNTDSISSCVSHEHTSHLTIA